MTIYHGFFKSTPTRPTPPPARVAVQVAALAGNASVEIQCNAALSDHQRPTIVVPSLPPTAGFPLSWATEVDGIVYASGMQGFNASGHIVEGGIKAETTQALQNLNEILKSSASDAGSVVGCSVWLTDMGDFAEMNEAYKAFWPATSPMGGLPTRVCVEAAALAGNAKVEIQCTAVARQDPHHQGPPQAIKVPGWPEMAGFPFSAAATIDNLAFISGNQGVDMSTSKLVEGGAGPETTQTLKDIQAAAEAAGTGLADVVGCEVSLTDMKDFAAVNKAYADFWPSSPPSRVAVQVGKLARGASVEIRCLAAIPAKQDAVELVV
ncbi:Rida [Symbiodinium natans]|uniref:Rida protein n=1 Tax=Symbiodinium natans TaxID=878477 RepID=A0A812SKI2_9DINO|nr:Rida [Symbiodinium natans]